mgnify:CR=1 FL=1
MKKDTSGPAFPNDLGKDDMVATGMTLRDYFAAKAMQGLIMTTNMWANREDEDIAECAYAMADAMLKAREA